MTQANSLRPDSAIRLEGGIAPGIVFGWHSYLAGCPGTAAHPAATGLNVFMSMPNGPAKEAPVDEHSITKVIKAFKYDMIFLLYRVSIGAFRRPWLARTACRTSRNILSTFSSIFSLLDFIRLSMFSILSGLRISEYIFFFPKFSNWFR